MLLALAGLDRYEKIMVQASVNNARTFEKISDALILQHPRVHLKESRRTSAGKGTSSKGKGKGRKGFFRRRYKGQGKGYRHIANIADEWYEDYPDAVDHESWNEEDEHEGYEEDDGDPAAAYLAGSDGEDEGEEVYDEEDEVEIENPVEAAELQSIAFLADADGHIDHLDQDAEGAASYIQESTTAFMTFSKGKGKGKSKGRKGYPVRSSTLSIDDRKAKLQDLKSRTSCKDCGRRGHWRGDVQCTMKKGSSGSQTGSSRHRAAKLTLNLSGSYGGRICAEEHFGDNERLAYMAGRAKASPEVVQGRVITPPPPIPVASRRAAATRTVPVAKASSSSGSSGYEPSSTVGTFAGMTFRNVHEKYPAQYIRMKEAVQKGKTLPPEQDTFVRWVDESEIPVVGHSGAVECSHEKVSHAGSSVRYKRHTCLNPSCGISWNEERDTPIEDPEFCAHLRTDHRGSSKAQLRTFCKDCGTVIDIADRSVAKEVEAEARTPTMTIEEAALLERVINGGNVYKHEILHALNTMTEAVGSLNQGEEYSLKSVSDAFLDHLDRAREALRNPQGIDKTLIETHTAFSCVKGSEPDSEEPPPLEEGPPPLVSSSSENESEKARQAEKGSEPDSDSSGPPLVSSSSDGEWERTRKTQLASRSDSQASDR
jgi:hypothetical protein